MKKTVNKDIEVCDYCGTDENVFYKCTGCNKDICLDCKAKHGKEFRHAVYCSGTGDGFYCSCCLSKKEVMATSLFKAYQEITFLRNEEMVWYKNFKERYEKAEKTIKELNKNI